MKTQARVVVIGVGNELRGDDGAGPEVVARLADRLPGSVELLRSDGDPFRLIEAWTGATLAVVVDAVTGSPADAGQLHRLVVSADRLVAGGQPSGPATGLNEAGGASSHSLGLGTAVGLAQALGRMPGTLIVHAVGAADFSLGRGLSAPVAAAMAGLTAAVLADVTELTR